MIVYKKTDEWYIEGQQVTTSDNKWYNKLQRMTTSGTTSDNKWQRVTTSGTTSDKEWQRITTFDNDWYSKWQRVTTNDNKWCNEWQRVTTDDFEWQEVTTSVKFGQISFFQIIWCWYEPLFISLRQRLLQAVVIDVFKIYVNLSKSTIVVFLKLPTSYLLFIIKMCFFQWKTCFFFYYKKTLTVNN